MDCAIRVGTPDDVDDMMSLAMLASSENGFINAKPEKMLQEIFSALSLHRGMVGIIGDPGNVEAAVLLRIGEMWYSGEAVVEERAIFIHPDFRHEKGDRAAQRLSRHRRLCEFSKKTADSLNLPLIIGVLSNQRTEGKIRLYERQFGKPAGAFFLYGASTGHLKAAG